MLAPTSHRDLCLQLQWLGALSTARSLTHAQVPKRLVIVGSGYIAVEFASIFNGLGTEVHLVFRQDQPLRGFDGEVMRSLGGWG